MVNYWAVLVSAIVSMVIGSIWYGPLFGKLYMTLMGMDKLSKREQDDMKKNMIFMYIGQFVASLVMFYTLAWFISGQAPITVFAGVHVALLVWIGFVVPLKLGETIWGGKYQLFWLGIGHMFVSLLAAGAIIGAFG